MAPSLEANASELTLPLRVGPPAGKLSLSPRTEPSRAFLGDVCGEGTPGPAGRGQSLPSCLSVEPGLHRPADVGQESAREGTGDWRAGGSQAGWTDTDTVGEPFCDSGGRGSGVLGKHRWAAACCRLALP